MPTWPTEHLSWDHARLDALEQQASAERAQLWLDIDMLAARRALQRGWQTKRRRTSVAQ
ncbi:hypothetical protein [Rhodopseudomonas sp. BR0C11]|uniref:hypothetical protein n=1 Tax=Rhodopseudomonas sp. BR0C11 TaxID=2269370 RepID=UPI001FEE0E95|nr:hypothetical protein [Rhodopseudomonas sp. BR0C11]